MSTPTQGRRAVLIGTESLLAQCGDILLQRGHAVAAIATPSHALRHWADELGIQAVVDPRDLGGLEGLGRIDWVFSITHLAVLPREVLALAEKASVNFHDGPLPEYAGLNTPTWALVNGEESHGITWHLMTDAVDAGPILVQLRFAISPGETSLSLNAKCFAASLESFGQVLEKLEREESGVPQQAPLARVYRRRDRPGAACAIDWSLSSEEIQQSVRALDFGPYANPVGLPTAWMRGRPVVVQTVEVLSSVSDSAPGTVLSRDAAGPRVATGSGEVRLTAVRLADGRMVTGEAIVTALGLEPGDRFDPPAATTMAAWRQAIARTAKHEESWVRQLNRETSPSLPAAHGASVPAVERILLTFPAGLESAQALGLMASVIMSGSDRDRVAATYSTPETRAAVAGVEAWFTTAVPVELDRLTGESPRQAATRLGQILSATAARGVFARDILLRYPVLRARIGQAEPSLALAIGPTASAMLLQGSALTVWVDSEAGTSAWVVDGARLDIGAVRQWVCQAEAALRAAVAEPVAPSGWKGARLPLTTSQAAWINAGRTQVVGVLEGAVDRDTLERAWRLVAERHESLRTTLRRSAEGSRVQEIHPAATISIRTEDATDQSAEAIESALARLLAEDEAAPEREAPEIPVTLLCAGSTRTHLIWSHPAAVLDGQSARQVTTEVLQTYDAMRRGTELSLPEPVTIGIYHDWLAGSDLDRHQRYWRARLNDVAGPTPAPGSAGNATGPAWVTRHLDPTLVARLGGAAGQAGASLEAVLLSAWAMVLGRHAGADDVVVGLTRSGRRKSLRQGEAIVGQLTVTAPIRVRLPADGPVPALWTTVEEELKEARAHEHAAPAVHPDRGGPLYLTRVVVDGDAAALSFAAASNDPQPITVRPGSFSPFALHLQSSGAPALVLRHDLAVLGSKDAEQLVHQVVAVLESSLETGQTVGRVSLLGPEAEAELLERWNATERKVPTSCVHRLFALQAKRTPDRTAVIAGPESLTYRDLDRRANRLARKLVELGVGPDQPVGLGLGRTPDLLVGMLGIQKAGGAYLPLDPGYPADRLAYMLSDSGARVLVTDRAHQGELPAGQVTMVLVDELETTGDDIPVDGGAAPHHLAYVIYTSGSTGKPKGVMVEHRNVVNFFAGMDERLGTDPGTWLAVTSPSFDISVLELCWTLARGFTVVLAATDQPAALVPTSAASSTRPVSFSLFYFASGESDEGDKYRLLLEGARFADRHDFEAVWTPERHFHAFGGLYPNPAVAGAAVASITEKVGIRAGSVVLPLHHPIRVAEDWSLVDNLSRGRVGISFAAGWQPNDFVLRPEAFAKQKEVMFRDLETVRRLWRGETLEFPGATGAPVKVRTLPRPVQPELPFWITTAGNPETFEAAGRVGANLLTHLLGQSIDELAGKIALYRKAWREAGHPGEGKVTLMLHTFVADDDGYARSVVKSPLVDYLKSSVSLIRHYAWAFPAFRNKPEKGDGGVDLSSLSEEELTALLDHAFDRYYETSGLFGTQEQCLETVNRVRSIGVDEIACLIDFGVPTDLTLAHLEQLEQVKQRATTPDDGSDRSIAAELLRHRVTHMQCTPVLARLLAASPDSHAGLRQLRRMLVGGEAFPPDLAAALRGLVAGEIHNMYGPTETTIWSTSHRLNGHASVPLGTPIANTRVYVLDETGRPVPVGVPGELWIGGDGVARGYLHRPELTAERFQPDRFAGSGARMYRTGDLVRWKGDGTLEFLGRLDHQVKIRGFRIELGEIEASLQNVPGVAAAVVVARGDPADRRLVAYVVARSGAAPDSEPLRARLRDALPEYMVPSQIVWLDALPLTPNGKVDRKALPEPNAVMTSRPGSAAPSSELEQTIASLWQEVLRVPSVGLDDNFFDLGGHSLLAVQAHRRLREALQRDLAITVLFQFPTVRSLAGHLAGGKSSTVQEGVERAEGRLAAIARRRAVRRGGA
jgi:natural product biosynthesis luciferase-like monooxygenase protein